MHLWNLCVHIGTNTGFQFDGYVVIPDSDLLDPASYQRFVKFGEVGSLLRNIILQVIDPLYFIALSCPATTESSEARSKRREGR